MYDRNVATQIIRQKRSTGYYCAFSVEEVHYVTSHSDLSDGAKMLWLLVASKTTLDEQLSFRASHEQIGDLIGKKSNTTYKLLKELEGKGFLASSADKGSRIKTYYIQLPSEGLKRLQAAPDRGQPVEKNLDKVQNTVELNPHYAQELGIKQILDRKNILSTSDKYQSLNRKNILSNPDKNPTLYINNINNIKNHNIHNKLDVDISGSEQKSQNQLSTPDTVKNANALVVIFQNKLKACQEQLPELSSIKARLRVLQEFSKEEQQALHSALTANVQPPRAMPSSSVTRKPRIEPVNPASDISKIHSHLVELTFEGQSYFIEEEVKNKVLHGLTKLYESGQIKGSAKEKPINQLTQEFLYYITKAGSTSYDKGNSQLKRYYTAKKVCLNGGWQTPKGMMREASEAREQKWQLEKRRLYGI